jgi:hypothetical protein
MTETLTISLGTRAVMFEPGADSTNTFSARFESVCEDTSKRIALTDLKIDVVAAR